jgi:putative zinc finger/helix-turn-helix YgiT family protein
MVSRKNRKNAGEPELGLKFEATKVSYDTTWTFVRPLFASILLHGREEVGRRWLPKMATRNCPICGNKTLEEKQGEYRFEPPPNIPGGEIRVPNAAWSACSACGEEILPHALTKAIEAQRYKRLGLLTPDELRGVREKTGLSAVDISRLLGVGEKTYTRWENGRSLQNKANDTLVRLLDRNAAAFASLDAERDPERQRLVSQYIDDLRNLKGRCPYAMAAHGGDLGVVDTQRLRRQLKRILEASGEET